MKRMHIHIGVKNIDDSVRFYNALFGAEPAKLKPDYAKWMLEDPRINFAISTRAQNTGVDHLGFQVDDAGELDDIRAKLSAANISTHSDGAATCCYAKSEKSWVEDPNGIAWETYHTMEDAQIFSNHDADIATGACCVPDMSAPKNSCGSSDKDSGCCG